MTLSNAIDFGIGICQIDVAGLHHAEPGTAPYGPQKNDGMATIEGHDTNLGWIAGANWRPTDSLSFGYSHRSEIDHETQWHGRFRSADQRAPRCSALRCTRPVPGWMVAPS